MNKSRRTSLKQASGLLDRVIDIIRTAKDDEQECLDNLPERAGFTPDFSVLAAERVERIDRNYSENYSKKKVTTAIEQDFIDDYSSWKQAFA